MKPPICATHRVMRPRACRTVIAETVVPGLTEEEAAAFASHVDLFVARVNSAREALAEVSRERIQNALDRLGYSQDVLAAGMPEREAAL